MNKRIDATKCCNMFPEMFLYAEKDPDTDSYFYN